MNIYLSSYQAIHNIYRLDIINVIDIDSLHLSGSNDQSIRGAVAFYRKLLNTFLGLECYRRRYFRGFLNVHGVYIQ